VVNAQAINLLRYTAPSILASCTAGGHFVVNYQRYELLFLVFGPGCLGMNFMCYNTPRFVASCTAGDTAAV
jgi:hypothetical protein